MNGNWNVSNFSCDEGQLIAISCRIAGLPRFGMRDEWSGHLVTSLSIRRKNAVVVKPNGDSDLYVFPIIVLKSYSDRGTQHDRISVEALLHLAYRRKRCLTAGLWRLYEISTLKTVRWKSQSGNILIAERDANDDSSFQLELRSKAESGSFFRVILRSVLG